MQQVDYCPLRAVKIFHGRGFISTGKPQYKKGKKTGEGKMRIVKEKIEKFEYMRRKLEFSFLKALFIVVFRDNYTFI
jgi:hypothetical protein